ncbi:accessory Sec system protein Asp2 [Fructilactobacillus myrtifloralis]|uniref:Accessory Sec system protein Asp2 n=1 Tax=Fructilactobacillus myrtifloralis TaxID=2940301 RepID=A0ABY5BLW1_9LACO|nr:accessory Sec system protein Asp2 [Fructilactobacillus myrtifloralis]USS84545.1 accessory Sec system protein Asp2 [Fructilactobacillus myrtifloralis]
MAQTTKVIQLGGSQLLIQADLSAQFTFQYFPLKTPEDVLAMEDELVENNAIKGKYQTAVFLLGIQSFAYLMPELLQELPAHQIIYDQAGQLPPEIEKLLQTKLAKPFDLQDRLELARFIEEVFFGGQYGLRLDFEQLEITPAFKGCATQLGNGRLTLGPVELEHWTQAINERMTLALEPDTNFEFWPEFDLNSEAAVQFKLYLLDQTGQEVLDYLVVDGATVSEQAYRFRTPSQSCMLYVSVFLQGQVTNFSLQNLHIRKYRRQFGTYLVDAQMITDPVNGHGQVAAYFNPGDGQPPLNVYFSGFRTAEGFEGNRMMSQLGDGHAPFLLIADERLAGGAFYIGSPEFEAAVIQTIQACLKQLHLDPYDLILSGLSMGTTAALYYAANLEPHAVIVGKPLVNLGTIAANERINRPHQFETSLDLLLLREGATDQAAQTRLNQYFWHNFATGDFTKTTFAIAYMRQDDYDTQAFHDLFRYLKDENPFTRILYKGLTGRHNDDTSGVVAWFQRQYENILASDFKRKGGTDAE